MMHLPHVLCWLRFIFVCCVTWPALRQVCGAILVKLVLDLWLTAGPGNAYPLVLRMLRKTLTSPKPQVWARVGVAGLWLDVHRGGHVWEGVGGAPCGTGSDSKVVDMGVVVRR